MTAKRSLDNPEAPLAAEGAGQWPMRQIEEALRGLRFGTVAIIVQDGVVIQLEHTEKRRLRRGEPQR